MNGGNNMPSLDGEKYSYDKKGISKYMKALKKKRKKKNKVKTSEDGYDNRDQHLWTPPGGDTP